MKTYDNQWIKDAINNKIDMEEEINILQMSIETVQETYCNVVVAEKMIIDQLHDKGV